MGTVVSACLGPQLLWLPPGDTYISWLWRPMGLHWWPQDCNQQRKSSSTAATSRAQQNQQELSLLVKEAY